MPFKTILAVTGPDLGNDDLKLARSICLEAGAHLSVLVAQMAAPPPIGEYAAVVSDAWLEERREDEKKLKERCADIRSFLAAGDPSADVCAEYQELAGTDEAIGRRARYADLTMIGPQVMAGATLKDKIVEGVLFSSGKPLLLAPAGARVTLKPKRVMVAWDARIEASRAVREALEILSGADDVRIVLVDPSEREDGHGAEPGADVAAYLARHGAKVTVECLPREGRSVAEIIRRRANDLGAELLVMGAYGHSRLRERIFGGVTRSLLENPALPVFMAR